MRYRVGRATALQTFVACAIAIVAIAPLSTNAAEPTLPPPTISDVSAYEITPTTARITWTVDRPATGQVQYGTSSAYGLFSELEPSFTYSTHIQRLTGLDPGTTYHYRVRSEDESGQAVQSEDRLFTTLPLATQAPSMEPITAIYGSAINADSLANSRVGGPFDQKVAYRFRATESSALDAIHIYTIGPEQRGYGAGTGGTMRISVRTDDGTDNHWPSRTILARLTVDSPQTSAGRSYSFSPAPELQAGELYHIVFENMDRNPRANFVSVNGLFVFDSPPRRQPRFANTDWAQLTRLGGSDWSAKRDKGQGTITPIMSLDYANGERAGLGYMEVWSETAKTISGPSRVRQHFYVDGIDRLVSSISVRLARLGGSGPLTVRLESQDGDVIATGEIPASSVERTGSPAKGGSTWARLMLERPITLPAGAGYNLVLSADRDTRYSIFGLREGVAYGYPAPTYFSMGGAEYDDGSGWVALEPPWRGPLDESDLQFYLQ